MDLITAIRRNGGIGVDNFDLLSKNETFAEDLMQLEHSLEKTLNEVSLPAEQKTKIFIDFKKHLKSFYDELATLEVIALLAAFIDKDGKFIVDLFKSWNESTNRYQSHDYLVFMKIIFSRYFMGFYYKLIYLVIIAQSEIEYYNLHHDLLNENNKTPSLELFRQKSSEDIMAVSLFY